MNIRITLIFTGVLLFSLPWKTYGQTCSCAGAPLIGSQSVGSISKGNLVAGITYQYNDISNLYSGGSRLENRTVTRNTQSTLFEFNYGITDRLALSGTATLVQKSRKTGLHNPGNPETLTTRGIGDGLLMLTYAVHHSIVGEQYRFDVSGGVKVPFGESDLTQDGLALNADMQPGTGAWDAVIGTYYSAAFSASSSLKLIWQNSFRLTGTNDRFEADDNYRFGNELISTLGATNTLTERFNYAMMFRYRSTSSDRLNGQALPNTGGKWVSIVPSLNYQLNSHLSLQVSGQLPVYQHLSGTQPTTAFTLSGSLFYNFNSGKQGTFF